MTAAKIRDWLVYTYNVLPKEVVVGRKSVQVVVREHDVGRLGLDLERMSQSLATFVKRDADVTSG